MCYSPWTLFRDAGGLFMEPGGETWCLIERRTCGWPCAREADTTCGLAGAEFTPIQSGDTLCFVDPTKHPKHSNTTQAVWQRLGSPQTWTLAQFMGPHKGRAPIESIEEGSWSQRNMKHNRVLQWPKVSLLTWPHYINDQQAAETHFLHTSDFSRQNKRWNNFQQSTIRWSSFRWLFTQRAASKTGKAPLGSWSEYDAWLSQCRHLLAAPCSSSLTHSYVSD